MITVLPVVLGGSIVSKCDQFRTERHVTLEPYIIGSREKPHAQPLDFGPKHACHGEWHCSLRERATLYYFRLLAMHVWRMR